MYCRGNKSNKLAEGSQFSIISPQLQSHKSSPFAVIIPQTKGILVFVQWKVNTGVNARVMYMYWVQSIKI